jgi:hypothetical protein
VRRALAGLAAGFAAGCGFAAAVAGLLLAADAWADRRARRGTVPVAPLRAVS